MQVAGVSTGGGKPTPEQSERMKYYMSVLGKLDKEQKTLKVSMERAAQEVLTRVMPLRQMP